jgi:hypothetical protein
MHCAGTQEAQGFHRMAQDTQTGADNAQIVSLSNDINTLNDGIALSVKFSSAILPSDVGLIA